MLVILCRLAMRFISRFFGSMMIGIAGGGGNVGC